MRPSGSCPLVAESPAHVGLLAAELVANRLLARPHARVVLPTGRTPEGMYRALRERARAGGLDAASATLFQLDEYLGLAPSDPRSFQATLRGELEGIRFGVERMLDGAGDVAVAVPAHQAALDAAPLDLAVLGLGRDGHVAFDEPGSTLEQGVRRVALHEVTRADAADVFGGLDAVPREALTVGLRTLAAARELLVLVTGEGKADALHAMLEGPVGPDAPASLLRNHPRMTVIADRDAVARLRPRPQWGSDRALIVLGHREPGINSAHRASAQSFARLRHAALLARREPVRAVVLTGWTRTNGLSEAEQMHTEWPVHLAPALLENAGRNTAQNATRSLPIVLAIGGIRRVDVVTSAWHLRAPWFFRLYRGHGIEPAFAPTYARGNWARGLWGEAAQVALMRAHRRAALADMRLPEGAP